MDCEPKQTTSVGSSFESVHFIEIQHFIMRKKLFRGRTGGRGENKAAKSETCICVKTLTAARLARRRRSEETRVGARRNGVTPGREYNGRENGRREFCVQIGRLARGDRSTPENSANIWTRVRCHPDDNTLIPPHLFWKCCFYTYIINYVISSTGIRKKEKTLKRVGDDAFRHSSDPAALGRPKFLNFVAEIRRWAGENNFFLFFYVIITLYVSLRTFFQVRQF